MGRFGICAAGLSAHCHWQCYAQCRTASYSLALLLQKCTNLQLLVLVCVVRRAVIVTGNEAYTSARCGYCKNPSATMMVPCRGVCCSVTPAVPREHRDVHVNDKEDDDFDYYDFSNDDSEYDGESDEQSA